MVFDDNANMKLFNDEAEGALEESRKLPVRKGARFSECRTWRYALSRTWNEKIPSLIFCGLNPSTADEEKDDPTITGCIERAHRWGFGGLTVVNLFGFRATEPKDMMKAVDPVGPENDKYIVAMTQNRTVLCGWGNDGVFQDRARKVLVMIQNRGDLVCLKVNKNGTPQHPLYIAHGKQPIPYKVPA